MESSAAISSRAGCQASIERGASAYGKCRRKQYRQWTAQVPVVTSSTRPWYFCSRPGSRAAAASSTGSVDETGHVLQFARRAAAPAAAADRPDRQAASGPEIRAAQTAEIAAPHPLPPPRIPPATPAAGKVRPDREPRLSSPPATRRSTGSQDGAVNLGRTTGSAADRMVISIFAHALAGNLPSESSEFHNKRALPQRAATPFVPQRHRSEQRTPEDRSDHV